MSLILAFGALQGLVVSALLLASQRNQAANRALAGLLAITVLRILPYILGYAGFYDAYPWLSFAPYNAGLAFGPLVYLYVARLTQGRLPNRWGLHLLPPIFELSYYAILFCQPLSFKNVWDLRVQEPWFSPAEQSLTLLSAAIYTALAYYRYRHYQQWLSDHVSFSDEFRIVWIRNFLLVFSALLLLWTGFVAFSHLLHPLNYFHEFPLYIGFALFVYYLGLEGWRHAGDTYPDPAATVDIGRIAADQAATPELASSSAQATGIDWRAQGASWLNEVQQRELWRDADLSSAILARELGTNTAYLSRALNEGLGQGFNECINRLRVDAVQRSLATGQDGRDLLAIALEAGFRSKASFNRAFKAYTGQTPSSYRKEASHIVNTGDS